MNQTHFRPPLPRRSDPSSSSKPRSGGRLQRLALCVAALALSATQAAAQIVYEGFSGTGALTGSNGGYGWAGPWQSGAAGVTTTVGGTGFEYVDVDDNALDTSPGAGAIFPAPTSGNRFYRMFSSALGASSGTAYISFMTQFDGTQSTGTEMAVSLIGNGTSDIMTLFKPYGWDNRLVLYDERGFNFINDVVAPINPTLERLFVMRLDLGGGTTAGTSRLRLYMNPALDSSTLSSPVAELDNLGLFPVSGISFMTRGVVNAFRFDEIRVGTTLSDVIPYTAVPEPATTAFVSGVLIAGWGAWRARSRRSDMTKSVF